MPHPEVVASSLASGLLLGGMLALTALGLSVALGVMRLVNLAHGEFLVLGAYLGFYLLAFTGLDPLLALPLVGLAMAALAWPLQRLLVAPLAGKGMEAPMMTMFGVSIILQNLFVQVFSADSRSIDLPYAARALHLGPVTVPWLYLLGFGLSAALVLAVHGLVAHTGFGRALRASAADPAAAAACGVDVRRVHALAFALGAACAAMGGVLLGTAFSFNPSGGATYLLISLAVVVLGGIGHILGTLLAGMAMGLLQSAGALWWGDGYRDLVGLVLFLVVLALRPTGLVSKGGR
ncbi:branched-chain amino acid ABC transporter permease [Ideonella livida]|uniref:Branched-chain amino acid ABC transporter permease n=1 Tax=Ideonella livida TaxID=2707176 RepID=A0A7C9TMH5_9BURK|nr:branched-chain amino acid ABC transporter permease [Ideonella livida]NDY93224.1 branched-chain amino acid ABC transporter permease [Ideonella livida]